MQDLQEATSAPWLDSGLDITERARRLLAEMTREEKLAQLGTLWAFEIGRDGHLVADLAETHLRAGIGGITRPGGATNLEPAAVARFANEIQRYLVERTRLGIPAILHEETLHGLMARDATCYPQAIGQAATWDPSLVEAMARQIGRRMRETGTSQALAPILDITRDPRWGRIEETFGEDAYLVAELAAAYVRGIEDTPEGERPAIATAKHLVGHGVPEGGLNQAPVHIGERELMDAFLFPFEAIVRTVGIGSVMHAYDDLDGVPCVASRELLTTILRERWGFDGIVVSDYAGIDQLVTMHELADDLSDAARLALDAGVDMDLPHTSAFGAPLRQALASGRVPEGVVDEAVGRVLHTKLRLGLFERPYVDETQAGRPDPAEGELAARMAERSMVLLQNDGILPLATPPARIAVIGPNAHDARSLMGDYAHVSHIETLLEQDARNGVGAETAPGDLVLLDDELEGVATILEALRERLPETELLYSAGGLVTDATDADIAAAVEVARATDLVVLVLGERSGLTEDATCGESRDRWDIRLPGRQQELFTAIAGTGTPVILVVVSGRPLALEAEAGSARAILQAWVPGDVGGAAIADVLLGRVAPGGKLPVTLPRHVGQVPIYYGHRPSGGRSHWRESYVDGSNTPLWPFGFGLSYTTFAMDELRLDRQRIPTDGAVDVSIRVRNTGERAGDEVVQLYLRGLDGSVTRPVQELRGFTRLTLGPGAACRVTFRLDAEQLAITGLDRRRAVEPGRFRLMVGSSSADIAAEAELVVEGRRRIVTDRTVYFTSVRTEPIPE